MPSLELPALSSSSTGTSLIYDAFGFAAAAWHPILRQVYEYWFSIRPGAGLPGRQHIDPSAITAALPHLYIVDVTRDPMRFRYRLVGTAYVELMGRDTTGAYYDEVHPGFTGEIRRQYTDAVEHRRPAYRKGRTMYVNEERRWPIVERVIAPLAKNGSDVDMILGAIVQVALE
ncbi:MAG: PAS domain-containing protein [Alphaproteobacteria bacterium]|nr:PAS domain-containing protein [Alphaproteobacteria bacterium]